MVDLRRIDSTHAAKLREANHSLSLLSYTDPLTGVFNRRYLDGFIDKIARRRSPPMPAMAC